MSHAPFDRIVPLRLQRWTLWALVSAFGALPAFAQTAPPTTPNGLSARAAGSLNDQMEMLKAQIAASDLTDDQKTQAQDELKSANAALTSATAIQTQTTTLRSQVSTANTAKPPTTVAPALTAERFSQWQGSMRDETSIAALERLLSNERTTGEQLRQQIDQLLSSLSTLLAQPAQISDALVALRQRSDQLANPAPASSTAPPLLQRAQAIRRAAEKEQVDAEIALRRTEQDTAGWRQNELEAQLQSAQQDLAQLEPRAAWLNQRIAQLSRQKLMNQAEAARARAEQLRKLGPAAVGDLAQANAQLAQEVMDDTAELTSDREQLTSDEQAREQISAVLRDAQARLSLSGNSAAIGHWLWQQRLGMPSLRALQRQRQEVLQDLSDLRLRQYALADLRRSASSPAATADPTGPDIEAQLLQLRSQQSQLSNQLTPLLAQRVSVLEQEDRLLATVIDRGTQLRSLMDRELLWVPSHPPIDMDWLRTLPNQLASGLQGMRPKVIGGLLRQDMAQHPLLYVGYFIVVFGLWRLRRFGLAQLDRLATRMRDVLSDRFAYTVLAIIWSGAVALLWPLTCVMAGLLLRRLGDSHMTDAEALGSTLVFVGMMGLGLASLHALIRPNGLAEAHLRWGQQRLNDMRHAWVTAACLLVPAAFMAVWPLRQGTDAAIGSYARLAVMAIGIGMGWLTHWMLRRERLWPNIPHTLNRVLTVVIPAGYFLSTLGAAAGYVYSAVTLIDALLTTALVVVVAQTAYGLLDRWLLLGERRLALKARQRGNEVVDQESNARGDNDDAAAIELVAVSAQGRRLLKVVRIVIVLVGLTLAWRQVAPALLRLDAIQLWHFSDKGVDGKDFTDVVTANDLMLAMLLLGLTFSLARNIPGLVELVLSASRRVTASTRYTVTTLLRYSVVMMGTVSALGLLGIRWSQLQWMAAALTVGLGFGLQEIFANFVSGLILLVERPFRVGDTITIDTISGTVTRIRTRATVVQDFENKENIIPNKTFITGQVVNWTLSDEVTRVTIPIGVAYGSPVPRVHELLLKVAKEQAGVLREPPPQSWFMAFGASSLDFELRIYVDGPGNRLPTQNAIMGRIAALFDEEGIEIAFPQMDVHVRDWPSNAPFRTTIQPPSAPGT